MMGTSQKLSTLIEPRVTYARSVNVERQAATLDVLRGYIPTDRSLEALTRIFAALLDPRQPRAWSITGPYGSGKSAFAAFLTALLGDSDSDQHRVAFEVLNRASSELAKDLNGTREQLKAGTAGFLLASATAQREPIVATMLRAFDNGIQRRWTGRGRRPKPVAKLRGLLNELETGEIDHPRLYEAILDLSGSIEPGLPVLVIIDEFGKNLEFAAERPAAGDLFILQQLAEAMSGQDPLITGTLLTFQHLAFADYAFGLPTTHLQEWNKIQGRFEDVSFLESRDQTIQLVGAAISPPTDPECKHEITKWSHKAFETVKDMGLTEFLPATSQQLAGAYPLHPVCLAVLPELTTRYGQHDRSLFTFLSSHEPHSLPWFLEHTHRKQGETPLLGLPELYDYFVAALGETASSGSQASRWLEIQTVVRESTALDRAQQALLKTIAMLNLVASSGSLRASPAMLDFACANVLQSEIPVSVQLQSLVDLGVVTYRAFAGEYRIWQGSDFDIAAAVGLQRDQIEPTAFVDELQRSLPMKPLVAQRHSHQTGTLRYFERRYVEHLDAATTETLGTHADGLLFYVLGDLPATVPASTADGRPVIAVHSPDLPRIREAALEVLSLTELLATSEALRADRVALSETRHRAALAQKELQSRLEHAFSPARKDLNWQVAGEPAKVGSPQRLASFLSDVSDDFYGSGPRLINEMLNRTQLTSQGAKARRLVIEGMIEHADLPVLGIEGYGPDRSMYHSILESTGIHAQDADGSWGIQPPSPESGLHTMWLGIEQAFKAATSQPTSLDTIIEVLRKPPYGARLGMIPVLIVAALIFYQDEVAIYQEGSFEPLLTVDLAERLVKIPERITIRYVKPVRQQQSVLDAYSSVLNIIPHGDGSKLRNATLLAILRPMISLIRRLPERTLLTKSLAPETLAVRDALVRTREPDQLVFADLPMACGFEAFNVEGDAIAADVAAFGQGLNDALTELETHYPDLLTNIEVRTARVFGTNSVHEDLRRVLARDAEALLGFGSAIETSLRSLLLLFSDLHMERDQWLEALGMNIAQKPPRGWSDPDFDIFRVRLEELGRQYLRIKVLYHDVAGQMTELSFEDRPAGSFDSVLLTLTRPDGNEQRKVIPIDDAQREQLSDRADSLLAELAEEYGKPASESVAALIAQRILTGSAEPQETSTVKDREDAEHR